MICKVELTLGPYRLGCGLWVGRKTVPPATPSVSIPTPKRRRSGARASSSTVETPKQEGLLLGDVSSLTGPPESRLSPAAAG
jgi:hypothetical protein